MSDLVLFTCKIHTLEQVIADSCALKNMAAVYAIKLGYTVLYVGKSQRVKERLLGHVRDLISGDHQNDKLQKIYKETNGNFTFQILQICTSLPQLASRELKFHRLLAPTCFSLTPHSRVENVKIRWSKDDLESLSWFLELGLDERGDVISHSYRNAKTSS